MKYIILIPAAMLVFPVATLALASYIYSSSIAKDRHKYPQPKIVYDALSKVMNNPPSFNEVLLWSVESRQLALDWSENTNKPKPYFLN